jgi:predicted metal-dependent hydrolase
MPREATGKTGQPTDGRNKPQRPRDELGRPLPWGERNLLEMEDYDSMTLEENHRAAVAGFNSGRFFPAHEAWETAWKQSKGTPDAEFFKGLSQLGAGYVHLQRGNRHGATTLLTRARSRMVAYPSPHFGLDTEAIAERCDSDIAALESGSLIPGPDALVDEPPHLRA